MMIKHVVTMDKDDFESLKVSIHQLRYNVNKLETSFWQGEILRYIEEIEETLGIEHPQIPEATVARWRIFADPLIRAVTLKCTNCGLLHSLADTTVEKASLPTVCPHCKAVMTGVE